MGWLYAIVGLLALGVAVALAAALWQNRGLWRDLRRADRPPARLLRDAFVVWSPLALLIVLLAVAANRFHAAAVALTYRFSTIDEYCAYPDSGLAVPCSGMDEVLPVRELHAAGVQADLRAYLADSFARERKRILVASAAELSRRAAQPGGALLEGISPRGVLGLPRAPEDDPELVRMKRETMALVNAPPPPPRDMLDTVRFVVERDERTARLREMTENLRARRAFLNEQAYSGLPTRQLGKLRLQHRIAHRLEPAASTPDAATLSLLAELAGNPGLPEARLSAAKRGLLLLLARNEAAALDVLAPDTGSPQGTSSLRVALDGLETLCTFAEDEPGLRQRAADFAEGEWESFDPATWTQSNAGTFPCEGIYVPTRVRSLGFRRSVERSIDRWFDELAADSFRRLGQLSLEAGKAPATAADSTRRLAAALPGPMRLGRAQCDWLHPANCAANAARSAAETGLASAQRQAVDSSSRIAGEAVAGASASLDARIAGLLVGLDARLAALRADAHAAAGRWFLLHDLLRLLGWLALALLAVKSFLYVLALETYHHEGELSVGFDDAPVVSGDYRVARRLAIDPAFPHALVTRQQLSNADNDVRLAPWPFSAPIARIFHRRYLLFTRGPI